MSSVAALTRLDQPISTGAYAVYPYKKALVDRYRFTSRFGEEVSLCEITPDYKHVWLPRALCPVGVNDNRLDGLTVHFPKDPSPRDNQKLIFAKTAKFLTAGESGLVSAYTGWGKTILGYHAAYVVKKKTLVITTKDDIYHQWLKGAEEHLGLKPHEIGEIRGDKCQVQGTKFCVAMIHSLTKKGKYPDWISEEFGLIIFDECHRVPADQFSKCCWMFKAKLRLGLSATIERQDGKELVLYSHIGPLKAATAAQLMIPKVLLVESDWQCPRTMREDKNTGQKVPIKIPHEPGKTTFIEKMMAADKARNRLIAEMVVNSFHSGRKVVIFSTLLDHLQALNNACLKSGISGKEMGTYGQATTKSEKEAREKIKARPILWTTFTMMGEGTNLPWLDTCILAIPRSKVEQPVGRIRREYEAKKPPVVMDIVDRDSPVFANYATSREKWYKSIGCKIVKTTV